jgi:PPOX class F420-dependent enzyme/OxyR family protein
MTTRVLDAAHSQYLSEHSHGVLATIGPGGAPQAKPVGFRYDPLPGTIDIGGVGLERSAKFRNIAVYSQVSFTIDDVPDPAAGAGGVRFIEIRGTAEQFHIDDDPPPLGVSSWAIRIRPTRVISYNIAGAGPYSADLDGVDASREQARPTIGLTGAAAARGRQAVEGEVHELQNGLSDTDAQTYNAHFADDVMWGSPYGATVADYNTLHAIHARMHAAPDRTPSRYEIVRVLAPTPDVVLAQVRRDELDRDGKPIPSHANESRFSEMALYVLVRRADTWWLAAGQNTKINIDGGAVAQ